MLRSLIALAATAALLTYAADSNPKPGLDGFDAFAEQALKDWKCSGFAVAVVQDGKVILSKGYGLRDRAQGLPVTPKTLFAIGSSTKSFTVTSLGVLVDQGTLEWDKPLREYLADFRLWDQFATERMTPRDLVPTAPGCRDMTTSGTTPDSPARRCSNASVFSSRARTSAPPSSIKT